MKVYFVSAGYDSCYYVRCMVPLQEKGWWGDISTLRGVKNSPESAARGVSQSDIVVFQRPMKPEHIQLIETVKAAGKKVVFDNDDTYIPNSGIPHIMKHIEGIEDKVDKLLTTFDSNLKHAASLCDLVTVTTEFLANEYKEVNNNVVVLPNCVNPDDWKKPIPNDTGKVRIGISGSVASSIDYEYAKNTLKLLSTMDNVQIVMFGLPPDRPEFKEQHNFFKEDIEWWKSLNTEWHGWVGVEDYQEKLRSLKLDICLIPRIDNYFNRCKSNLKYLEHSMLKIPVIAQGFESGDSPYQKDIVNGFNGFIAYNDDDWTQMTLNLINNPDLRKEIGENAYNYVKEHYSIQNNIHKWVEAYKKLIKQ